MPPGEDGERDNVWPKKFNYGEHQEGGGIRALIFWNLGTISQ